MGHGLIHGPLIATDIFLRFPEFIDLLFVIVYFYRFSIDLESAIE